MSGEGDYRARNYILNNYKDWYTYAYIAYRAGTLSVSPEIEEIFEAHGMSGRANVGRWSVKPSPRISTRHPSRGV